MTYEITIGLPVHTDVYSFQQCIRSIFAQTFKNWTLIIVCDGAEPEIVELALAIDDPRVQIIVEDVNMGLPYRLNQITQLAQTKYVARMDADDLMLQSRLQIQLDFLIQNPGIEVVACKSYLINESASPQGLYREPELPRFAAGFLENGILCHPAVIFSREWGLKNPYDPAWIRTEDKELWLRTCEFTSFARLPDALMLIRVPADLSYKKVALTSKYNRKLVRIYGPKYSSWLNTQYAIFKIFIKQYLLRLLQKFGLKKIVYAHKRTKISPSQILEIQSQIEQILLTPVPGWNTIRT